MESSLSACFVRSIQTVNSYTQCTIKESVPCQLVQPARLNILHQASRTVLHGLWIKLIFLLFHHIVLNFHLICFAKDEERERERASQLCPIKFFALNLS